MIQWWRVETLLRAVKLYLGLTELCAKTLAHDGWVRKNQVLSLAVIARSKENVSCRFVA